MEKVLNIKSEKTLERSTLIELIIGILTIVLPVAALFNVVPVLLISLAVIALGFSFLLEGIALWSNYAGRLEKVKTGEGGIIDFTGGITMEFIGGIAGIILGILSLVGVVPFLLLPVAAIVFGITHACGSGEAFHFREMRHQEDKQATQKVNTAIHGMGSIQLMIGLGALFFGIVGVFGSIVSPIMATSLAVLAMGTVELMKSTTWSSLFMRNKHA